MGDKDPKPEGSGQHDKKSQWNGAGKPGPTKDPSKDTGKHDGK